MSPPLLILSAYAAASAITFLAFLLDKRAAINNTRRTPEKTLHLLTILGGVPGALLAIPLLHHKNRKPKFYLLTLLIAAIHAALWIALALR